MVWSVATLVHGACLSHHDKVAVLEAMADDVVWNGGDLAALETQCDRIHQFYLGNVREIAPQSGPTQRGAR